MTRVGCFFALVAMAIAASLLSGSDLRADEETLAGQILLPVTIGKPRGVTTLVMVDPNTGECTPRAERIGGRQASVSNDGSQLAYMTFVDGCIEIRTTWLDEAREPVVAHRVTGRCNLVWAPDASRLLVDYCDATVGWEERGRRGLLAQRKWLVSLDGSEAEELKLPFGSVYDWSRDGKWLAMVCPRPSGLKSQNNLFVVRRDGSLERRLTTNGRVSCARFSPTGTRIAYYNSGDDRGLWTVGIFGSDPRCVRGADENMDPLFACWSPDGKHLAVTMVDSSDLPNVTRLEVMNADGSNVRIVELKGVDAYNFGMPQWREVPSGSEG